MLTPSDLSVRLVTTPGNQQTTTVSCAVLVKTERKIECPPRTTTQDTSIIKRMAYEIHMATDDVRNVVWKRIYGGIIEELMRVYRRLPLDNNPEAGQFVLDLIDRLRLPPADASNP